MNEELQEKIKQMDKCVHCLALELPGAVHDDVQRIWLELKQAIKKTGTGNHG